ncbi:MAG TPA: 30S ribosomal protein S20 [Ignavibacteriaceae bacterium]|jgi:small subunit ribosomal protein S20
MATHKSAKKRIRTTARKRAVNKNIQSRIKTSVKNVFASTNKEEAQKLYKIAVSVIDKSADRGKIHKNTAARKKARLTKYLNKLEAGK